MFDTIILLDERLSRSFPCIIVTFSSFASGEAMHKLALPLGYGFSSLH
jgi:hypothetical protein